MKAVLILPETTSDGNLIWMPPYLYPKDDLLEGIMYIKEMEYLVEFIEDGSGLAFSSQYTFEKVKSHFEIAFPWMDITAYQNEDHTDYQSAIFDYCLIVMPISRLNINSSIISETVCLFQPGQFQIELINIKTLDGKKFMAKDTKTLRDHITNITEISIEVFVNFPLIVFTKKLSFETYAKLNQNQDNQLIKECSNYADRMMDLLRYYNNDYNVPEALPAKPGVWSDRYSAMLCYFPDRKFGNIQAREVELKAFSMGIGLEASITDQLGFRLLLSNESNRVQNIARHALKLHSAIIESDNETIKFVQIMILFDFIGDPFGYGQFQNLKKRFIPCLTSDRVKANKLANWFMELTKGDTSVRTGIVHMGKNIEELVPVISERRALFNELHTHIYSLIQHIIYSPATTWEEYELERDILKNIVFP
jgi:hypothetical protein